MHPPHFLRAFARNSDGAVAVIFGLSLMVLLALGGLAVDYARTLSVQTELQSDLDAAVLGAAAQMTANADADLSLIANTYFGDNWKAKHNVQSLALNVVPANNNQSVAGSAQAQVPTTFMKLFGYDKMPISASSEVETTLQDVEVALVVDTTGSMEGAKLGALKQSAKTLIDTAYAIPKADEHVRIGIVPFSRYVNAGQPNRHKPWISVANDYSEAAPDYCRNEYPNAVKSYCVTKTGTGYNDGVPYMYEYEDCDWNWGDPVWTCTPQTASYTWNGCVGSRNNPLDTADETWTTPVEGLLNEWCNSPITPLSNDKQALKDQVDAFSAWGETYIPAGLFWGWTVLSKEAPFEEAKEYGELAGGREVRKIMVLMTDGANTLSPTYPHHNGSDAVAANTLTAQLCANIKAKDIEIFTIAFEVTDDAIKDVLTGCATAPGNFFDAATAAELEQAFHDIAKDFTPLRLSK